MVHLTAVLSLFNAKLHPDTNLLFSCNYWSMINKILLIAPVITYSMWTILHASLIFSLQQLCLVTTQTILIMYEENFVFWIHLLTMSDTIFAMQTFLAITSKVSISISESWLTLCKYCRVFKQHHKMFFLNN